MIAMSDSSISLLNTISEALSSATSALSVDLQLYTPPVDGISLLDVKNDLLLSYLQNLAFLIVFKLRHISSDEWDESIRDQLLEKLVELRIYLERGVRPIESRLKYQIDQVLKAADNHHLTTKAVKSNKKSQQQTGSTLNAEESDEGSGGGTEDADDGDDATDSGGENLAQIPTVVDELSYRPNIKLMASKAIEKDSKSESTGKNQASGAYKPPRITPTAMPEATDRIREPRKRKSQLLNEYIDEELSSAPHVQPSIGSNNTILDRGRKGMTRLDRQTERERTEYEERNFTRLPAISKAEKRKAKQRGELGQRDIFGGEDWTGLGGLGDRIHKSVAGGKSSMNVLQRREKRRATEDLPRGDGVGIGDTFDKRRRVLQARTERKGKRR